MVDVGYVEPLHVRATRPLRLMPHEMTHAHGAHEGGGGGAGHGWRLVPLREEVKVVVDSEQKTPLPDRGSVE